MRVIEDIHSPGYQNQGRTAHCRRRTPQSRKVIGWLACFCDHLVQEIGHGFVCLPSLSETRKQEGDVTLAVFMKMAAQSNCPTPFSVTPNMKAALRFDGHFRSRLSSGHVFGITPFVEQGATVVGEQSHHMIGNHRVDNLQIVALRLGQIAFCVLVVIGANGIILLV